MRFLVDAQLPPALARLLSALGHMPTFVTVDGALDVEVVVSEHVDEAGADGRVVFDDEDARFVRQGRTDLKVPAGELAGGGA